MAKIQFGLDGEVVSEDYSESIDDPSKERPFTDQQLAEALPFTDAKHSPEQISLDKMQADEKYMLDRANAIDGYDKDGKPRYTQPEHERQRLLRGAKGLRDSMVLQLEISKRTIAERYLADQAAAADLQAQSQHQDDIRKAALEEVKQRQIQGAADLIMKAYPKLKIG